MELTDLPYELQFEYLLTLPYPEIIKYCQINQTALREVCQSELLGCGTTQELKLHGR